MSLAFMFPPASLICFPFLWHPASIPAMAYPTMFSSLCQ
jgi:hypothetical protein